MNTMDDFIRKNPGMFNSDEPDPGHEDRFRKKLYMSGTRMQSSTLVILFRVAAIVVLVTVLSYFAFREFRVIGKKISDITLEKSNPELNEAERFYTSQLNIYYNKIQKLGFNNDKAEKEKVLHELSAMDEQVRAMKRDLAQNPEDERVMSAIINFYQVKIELMDVIIARAQMSTYKIL